MNILTIAMLGGTGDLGSGLARRWARSGHRLILGSRDPVRAHDMAQAMGEGVIAQSYIDAARAADVAVLTVPFALQAEILASVRGELAGKVLIDCTVPLMPPKVGTVRLPVAGSAARTGQIILGEAVTVVSAFQNVGATLLHTEDHAIECDVLVCSDDAEARQLGVRLVEDAGLRGIEAGALDNAAAAEALTSILITINRRYKAKHAGIRITGLPEADG